MEVNLIKREKTWRVGFFRGALSWTRWDEEKDGGEEVRRWCDGEEVRKNGENVGFFELVRTVTDVFTAF